MLFIPKYHGKSDNTIIHIKRKYQKKSQIIIGRNVIKHSEITSITLIVMLSGHAKCKDEKSKTIKKTCLRVNYVMER